MATSSISPVTFSLVSSLSGKLSGFGRIVNESVTPWAGLILTGCAVAATGLGIYRWRKSPTPVNNDGNFQDIKEKVKRSYLYIFGGFALTAASAACAHASDLSKRILQNSYLRIPLVIGLSASLAATLWIKKDNTKAKHVAWAIFNGTMGMILSPLGYLNQKIVAQAAAISLGLGGLLTLGAYYAPDRSFLAWEGPLLAALTSISLASLTALFFPGSAFAYAADRASLYGGLVIFTGLFMASTQRLIELAKTEDDRTFDPINAGMGIYIDGLNIFIRLLQILLENKAKEK